MTIDVITLFVVPNIYCLMKEIEFKMKRESAVSGKEL